MNASNLSPNVRAILATPSFSAINLDISGESRQQVDGANFRGYLPPETSPNASPALATSMPINTFASSSLADIPAPVNSSFVGGLYLAFISAWYSSIAERKESSASRMRGMSRWTTPKRSSDRDAHVKWVNTVQYIYRQ